MIDLVTGLICWGTISVPLGMFFGQFISAGEREDAE